MLVVVPNPNKVRIAEKAGSSGSPEKAAGSLGGIAGGFDGFLIVPTVKLGVAVGKGEAADIAVKNGEGIHPAGIINLAVNDPSSPVVFAWIGFFNKDHRFGGALNGR